MCSSILGPSHPRNFITIINLTFILIIINSGSHIHQTESHILIPEFLVTDDLETSQNLLSLLPNENLENDYEIAQIKFVTGIRHKRDLIDRDYHIIELYRPSTNSTTVIHLHRKPTLVSADFIIVVRSGDDEPDTLTGGDIESSNCLFHGSIPADPDGRVALSACGGHIGFSGLIVSSDGHLMIEPHPVHLNTLQETSELPHIIRLSGPTSTSSPTSPAPGDNDAQSCNSDELRVPLEDLRRAAEAERRDRENKDNGLFQGPGPRVTSSFPKPGGSSSIDWSEEETSFDQNSGHILTLNPDVGTKETKSRKRQAEPNGKKTVEIAVFADADFYNAMKIRYPKDTTNKLKNYVLTVINAMDLLYEQPSLGVPLDFRLVHLEIQKKWPSKLSKHGGKAKAYLTSFCDYAGDLNIRNELWDHALMLTGADLVEEGSSATAGLAWAGTMCYRYYSCSISEATQFGVVYVITHEIGHSMGMEHDGHGVSKRCDKNKYIMSPTTGPGKVSWSNCSSQNLKDFMKHGTSEEKERDTAILPDCLTESSRETKAIDYTNPSLPGQKYSADRQCNLAMGKRFSAVRRKTSPFNNICSMLYCGNTTHSISTHPALEGTPCDEGKHCHGGMCVNK